MPVFRKKGKPVKRVPWAQKGRLRKKERKRLKSVAGERMKQAGGDALRSKLETFAEQFGKQIQTIIKNQDSFFVLRGEMLLRNDRYINERRKMLRKALRSSIRKAVNSLPPHERALFLGSAYEFLSALKLEVCIIERASHKGMERFSSHIEETSKIAGEIIDQGVSDAKRYCKELFSELPKSARHEYFLGPSYRAEVADKLTSVLRSVSDNIANRIEQRLEKKPSFSEKWQKSVQSEIAKAVSEEVNRICSQIEPKHREVFLTSATGVAESMNAHIARASGIIDLMFRFLRLTNDRKLFESKLIYDGFVSNAANMLSKELRKKLIRERGGKPR